MKSTTLDYCRELGVAIEPFTNANADAYYYNESAPGFAGPLTDHRLRRRVARADYLGYVSELLAKAINQHALDASLGAADLEAVLEFLTSFGALNPQGSYGGSDRRGYATPPGAANQSGVVGEPYTLSDLLAANFGVYFPFELGWDQAMMMFQPVGGMDRIPYALAAALRGTIRYGAQEDRATSPVYRTLLEPVGRLYFAGDHLSYVTAWQHGAFESARHVVTAVHQRVLTESGR